MLYESGNWTYNINHFPGNIGQGTRTMMSWTNVSKYAQSIHADAYTAAIGSVDVSAADNTTKTKVINLVLNNEDSFGAGFWYLKTQAPSYHNNPTALRDGSVEDFQAYVEQGIGTTWNAEREDIWTKVNSAIMF
ncbi:hypothetical protein IWW50_002393 [Coemansia erecta]|nr:hypothetical protein IWW50_002393 [Coemansia erecta]